MRVAASDSLGKQSTRRDDDRITPLGVFLRKTSIDELPQLLNVLKGGLAQRGVYANYRPALGGFHTI